MFDFVQNNKFVLKVILGAVALTFVGFGVGSYSTMSDDPYLAKVGDAKIYRQDLERAINGEPLDAVARQGVLENLVRQELLLSEAQSVKLAASPEALRAAIAGLTVVQKDGRFDAVQYQEFLKSRSLTSERFEQLIARDLVLAGQVGTFSQGQLVSRTTLARLGTLLTEQRKVSAYVVKPENFAASVAVDEAKLKAYYQSHAKRYLVPEAAKLQYVVLSQAAVAEAQQVSDAEVQQYFAANKAELAKEERRAAHILLTAKPGEDKAKLKAEAAQLLKALQADPSRFAELAKARSQDPGSAAQGGELGFFGRGMMTKKFEDAVFALKPGQLSGVVETEFGLHIIKLEEVKVADLAAQRPQIEQQLKRQKAAALYRQQAEKLGELAYQQENSLDGVAKALKLEIKSSDWLERAGVKGDQLLGNAKLLEAAFAPEVLKTKRNSEVIELGNGVSAVVRVAEYRAQRQPALAEVKAQVEQGYRAQEASKLAEQAGQRQLTELKAGKPLAGWSPSVELSRRNSSGLAPAELRAVFSAPLNKGAGFVGLKRDSGEYVLLKVEQGAPSKPLEVAELDALRANLAESQANAELASYLDMLRQKFPVVVNRLPSE